MLRRSILCPVDFSEASRSALRFARVIAEHYFAGLTVLAVDDPLLTQAAAMVDERRPLAAMTRRELEKFIAETFAGHQPIVPEVVVATASGKPATEILRLATDLGSDLIVMGAHGVTGLKKLFFGSTTERVLRETHVPVLVTPAGPPGPASLEDFKGTVNSVLAPVDLSEATRRQVQVARGLADALGVPLLIAHVLEPLPHRLGREAVVARAEADRRLEAERALKTMLGDRRAQGTEIMIGEGDPAAFVAAVARERGAGAIVMGLHSTTMPGPRMGSVTYRVLCQTATPVLALPPAGAAASGAKVA